MIIYRSAVPSDVLDLINLVEDYCDEIGEEHEINSIKKYIDFQLGKIPTIVAAESDVVIGVISFVVMPSPFSSHELLGRKIACFVDKAWRDQGVGSELIARAEQLSKEAGAKKFYFTSNTTPSDTGYQTFETEYFKVL